MADKPITKPAKTEAAPTEEKEAKQPLERAVKYAKPEFKPEKAKPLPPLTNDGRPASTMQKIERAAALPPGAAEALGGAPFAMPPSALGKAAARMPQAPAAVEIPRTGNPSFDPPLPEVVARRESIATIKAGVASLLMTIQQTADRVKPHLEALSANAALVKEKEDFDTAEVEGFFAHLHTGIEKLKKS